MEGWGDGGSRPKGRIVSMYCSVSGIRTEVDVLHGTC